MTLYPHGYGYTMLTMAQLRARHEPNMHPVFAQLLFPWIQAQGGKIGIGGGYRIIQPSKPGFAPAGKSFHQDQHFRSGITAYCAVDLVHVNGDKVHRSPTWAEVPAQGSLDAKVWGVHCNVSAESWHMQPSNIDGYDSWVAAGRPDPKPLPPSVTLPLEPPDKEDDVSVDCINRNGNYYVYDKLRKTALVYPGNDWALVALLWDLEDSGVKFATPKGTPGDPKRVVPVPKVLNDWEWPTFDAAPTS